MRALRLYHTSTEGTLGDLVTEEWVFVLKLATMWQFQTLSELAMEKLDAYLPLGDPARWLCLARQYEVGKWLFPSLHALARRTKALQLEEVELLGAGTVVKMAEVRESFLGYDGGPTQRRNIFVSRSTADFSAEIKRLFSDELERAGVVSV